MTKIFGVCIRFMGPSKRCFGVRGVLRNPFGSIRSNLEAFYEKTKILIFFDFFKQKMKGFFMFGLVFEHEDAKNDFFQKIKP